MSRTPLRDLHALTCAVLCEHDEAMEIRDARKRRQHLATARHHIETIKARIGEAERMLDALIAGEGEPEGPRIVRLPVQPRPRPVTTEPQGAA